MNNMWKIKIDNMETEGWVKIPNALSHNYRELGLTAEEAIFLIDIISNNEEYIFYDTTYMSEHGCSKTLQRRRNALRRKGFLTWERFDKYDSETDSIKSSGFKYDTSKALNKVISFLQNKGQKCPSDKSVFDEGQKCPPDNTKRLPTKEASTKEAYTKEAFNNNPTRVGVPAQRDGDTPGETTTNVEHIIQKYYNMVDVDDERDDVDDVDTYSYASFTPPKEQDIDNFLSTYQYVREQKHLPKLKNIETHRKNLKDVDKDELVTLTATPEIIYSFFNYCDDKTFDMKYRYFECNSDRSPTIMFNESVYRRFLEWNNKWQT